MTANQGNSTPQDAECRRLTEALGLAQRDLALLGFEIHDGVVQDLTAAVMVLEGAGRQASFSSPEAKENFEGGVRLLNRAIASARQFVLGSIAFQNESRGLVAELMQLVERFRQELALPVTFSRAAQDLPQVPLSVEHLLLRIAQEALYNVWKHARATEVEVRLGMNAEKLELVIADNGVGFERGQVPTGHFGLEGMWARAKILDATLVLDTAPDHGTRVVVQMPLAVV